MKKNKNFFIKLFGMLTALIILLLIIIPSHNKFESKKLIIVCPLKGRVYFKLNSCEKSQWKKLDLKPKALPLDSSIFVNEKSCVKIICSESSYLIVNDATQVDIKSISKTAKDYYKIKNLLTKKDFNIQIPTILATIR